MTTPLSLDQAPVARNPIFRVTQYDVLLSEWSGQDYTLNLENSLKPNYFVMFYMSAASTGILSPDEYSATVVSDPFGTGGLSATGVANQMTLRRGASTPTVDGLAAVVVVECLEPTSADGFVLRDAIFMPTPAKIGAGIFVDSQALLGSYVNISNAVPFCGIGGGGVRTISAVNDRVSSVLARAYITTGPNTLNLERQAGPPNVVDSAEFTTYVVEWGSNWTVQAVNVSGTAGGVGLNSPAHFDSTAITSALRSRTWMFNTYRTNEPTPQGSQVLAALGDGVNELVTESSVSVGKWLLGVTQSSTCYVMTHAEIDVDWVYNDLENTIQPEIITVDEGRIKEGYRQFGVTLAMTYGQRIPSISWGASSTANGSQTETLVAAMRHSSGTTIDLIRSDDAVGISWTFWAASVDFGFLKQVQIPEFTPGPQQYIILPDLEMDGSTLSSVTTEDGFRVGPIIPDQDNKGRLMPFHTGDPNAAPVFEYRIATHGDLGEAGWIFREEGGGYYSWNGYDFIWGVHPHNSFSTNRFAICSFYSSVWDRVIVCSSPNSSSEDLVLRYYDQDGTPYTSTDLATITFDDLLSGLRGMSRALELDDGTFLLVALINDPFVSGLYDWQLLSSVDGGTTWVRVADAMVRNSAGQSQGLSSQPQSMSFAASGDWVRLVWTDATDRVVTMVSATRGGTWEYQGTGGSPITVNDNTESWDENGIALVGINDGSGTFILWVSQDGSTLAVDGYMAARDQEWVSDSSLDVTYPANSNIKRIAAVTAADGIFLLGYDDNSTAQTIGLTMNRFDVDDPTNADLQFNLGSPALRSAGTLSANFHSMGLLSAGRELVFVCGRLNAAGNAWDDGIIVGRFGGWSQRAVEDPSVKSGGVGSSHWASMWATLPHAGPYSRMDQNLNLTTVTLTNSDVDLNDSNVGDFNYWETFEAGSNFAVNGLAAGAILKVDASDGNVAGQNIGIYAQVNPTAGATGAEFWVSCTTTMIALWDLTGGVTEKAFLPVPGITNSFHEIRVGLIDNNMAVIAARPLEGKTWEERGEGWQTSAAVVLGLTAGTTMDAIQWGHQTNAGGSLNSSNWREFWLTEQSQAADLLQSSVTDNDRRGRLCVPRPQRIRNGVDVYWGGGGGYKQDLWTGRVALAYGQDNLFVDSPRFFWQAVGQTQQALVWDYGAGKRTHHEAMAIFGTRGRTAEIQYNTANLWTNPLLTFTMDATLISGGRVGRVDGQAVEVVAADQSEVRIPGSLVGAYLRVTAGSTNTPVGKTFRIVKAGNGDWLHLEGEVVGVNDSADYAANYNLQAGDTVEVFADQMATRYGEEAAFRYCRIVFSEEQIWNGKHAMGNVVAGPVHDFDPPLDWSWKDNEQPNTTSYRSKSGVRWAFSEGPSQRVIQGRVVGDYTQRSRESFRHMLREFTEYDVKPVALILDAKNTVEQLVLGYVSTGGQLDNIGWYQDQDGTWRSPGDTALQVVEVV